jgi:hypothetical protein
MSKNIIPSCGTCRYWNYDTDKLCLHHDHWLEERNPEDYCDKWEDGRKIRILDLLGYFRDCKKVIETEYKNDKSKKVFLQGYIEEIDKLKKQLKDLEK